MLSGGVLQVLSVIEKEKKKRVPLKFEGKFSHIAIRSAILHELECWVVKSQQKIKA